MSATAEHRGIVLHARLLDAIAVFGRLLATGDPCRARTHIDAGVQQPHQLVDVGPQRVIAARVGLQRDQPVDVVGGFDAGGLRPAGKLSGVGSHLLGPMRVYADQLHVASADDCVQRPPADVPGGPLDDTERAVGGCSRHAGMYTGLGGARMRRRRPMARSSGELDTELHLVLGDEELLVERAIAAVLHQARVQAGTDEVPESRLRAGEVTTSELAELLSPSLFADERVVVLEAAAEAGKDSAALIIAAAADLPPGTVLIVVHSGGGRAKALADELRKLGAVVHPCARITKAGERADFVRAEFRSHKIDADDDVVTAIIDAVGSDLRELAAACSQLVADTGGAVDVSAVRRYYSGKAEVRGFDIADKAVMGDIAGAVEALRWAMIRGEPRVVLADALAEAVHTIARVGPMSGDPYRLAAELGMPPWRVQKAQRQARGWSTESVAAAMRLVATLNADVKGAAADADYVLEVTTRRVAELVARPPRR